MECCIRRTRKVKTRQVKRKVKTWRLLQLCTNDASTNMAIDEAITTARTDDTVPNTLRLYRWKPSTVSVGRFQDVFDWVHVENCRLYGVDIVRRMSGGGTVYHDSLGEITYSVVMKEKDFGTTDVIQAYNKICNGLIEATRILGVDADFSPGDPRNCPNLVVAGKKISGSAQYHKGGVLLQHGTFLLDVDLKKMFAYLRVPGAKSISSVACAAEEKITSLKKECNSDCGVQEACEALVDGFQKALGMKLTEGSLTERELQFASNLKEEKYSQDSWNLKGVVHVAA